MKHRVKALVETEKRGLFGKKKVYVEKTVTVDGKTYRKMKREERNRPLSVDEMILLDFFLND